jgi:hypothetical protein
MNDFNWAQVIRVVGLGNCALILLGIVGLLQLWYVASLLERIARQLGNLAWQLERREEKLTDRLGSIQWLLDQQKDLMKLLVSSSKFSK